MRFGDAGHRVGRGGVLRAGVVEGSVRRRGRDRHARRQARDLESHERLDFLGGQPELAAPEAFPVVVAGVGADLDAQAATQERGRDGRRRRARMHTARDVGAVDVRQDRLIGARALAEVRVDVQLCAVSPCSSWMAWPTIGITASSDSEATFRLPGTLMMSVRWPTPAIERDSAAIGVVLSPARPIASRLPGTSYPR